MTDSQLKPGKGEPRGCTIQDLGPAPASSRFRHSLPVAALLLAACLPYLNSLPNSFHFDDVPEIVQNENIRSFPSLLAARPIGRWLVYATFSMNYGTSGLDSMPGWHVVNIFLHAGCILALYWTLAALFAAEPQAQSVTSQKLQHTAPFCAALLFAVHPLASEPINYIQARCVLMYTLFTLLALWCAIGIHQATSVRRKVGLGSLMFAIVAAASISKPVGLFFSSALPVLYCSTFIFPQSERKGRLILWGSVLIASLTVAAIVWLTTTGAWIGQRLNGHLRHYFWEQFIVFWRYMALAAWPSPEYLNVDHAVAHRPYSLTNGDVLLAVVAMLLIVLIPAVYFVRKKPTASFLLLAIPIGLGPYFILTSDEAMVEYRFYLPLAAFCGLVGLATALLLDRRKTVGRILLPIIVLALAMATASRNLAWRTDVSLWSDAASKSPRKARTINALAWALLSDKTDGNPYRALELAKQSFDPQCVDVSPSYNPYMVDTLAEAHFATGDIDTAIRIQETLIQNDVGNIEYFRKQLDRYLIGKRDRQTANPLPRDPPSL